MKSLKILIADDHSLVRLGLSALIAKQKNMSVVGEAVNGEESVALSQKLLPDIVIMDLMMPVINGVEATQLVLHSRPTTKILILTSFGTSSDVAKAIEAGAQGAILKDAPNDELIRAIWTIADGKTYFSDDIVQNIADDPPPRELTERQAEILTSVTQGMTNKDIARLLKISPESVKQHLSAIFLKLGVSTRSEAVAIALRKHLLKI